VEFLAISRACSARVRQADNLDVRLVAEERASPFRTTGWSSTIMSASLQGSPSSTLLDGQRQNDERATTWLGVDGERPRPPRRARRWPRCRDAPRSATLHLFGAEAFSVVLICSRIAEPSSVMSSTFTFFACACATTLRRTSCATRKIRAPRSSRRRRFGGQVELGIGPLALHLPETSSSAACSPSRRNVGGASSMINVRKSFMAPRVSSADVSSSSRSSAYRSRPPGALQLRGLGGERERHPRKVLDYPSWRSRAIRRRSASDASTAFWSNPSRSFWCAARSISCSCTLRV